MDDRKSTIIKISLIIFIIVVSGAFVYFIASLSLSLLEYKKATTSYTTVAESYFNPNISIDITDELKEETKQEQFSTLFTQNQNRSDFPTENVNLKELSKVNCDTIGWIMCKELGINYPIVQSINNEKYLNETFEGDYNKAGCIFLDYQNKANFTDRNTFVYGHHMKNGSMFGNLKKLADEAHDLMENGLYVYIYTQTGIMRYKIISCYETNKTSETYYTIVDKPQLEKYLDLIYKKSSFVSDVSKDDIEYMITLSTCHGKAGGSGRFVVHATLIDKYYYSSK